MVPVIEVRKPISIEVESPDIPLTFRPGEVIVFLPGDKVPEDP